MRRITHFRTELPYLLGSTNPCPNAVHMEPFSTSVFKVLIWIFATNTKICTGGRFTQVYTISFFTLSDLLKRNRTRIWNCYNSNLRPAPEITYCRPPRLATRLCIVKFFAQTAELRLFAWAPSIFRATSFGRWVVTHSLADFDFHDHRPAV